MKYFILPILLGIASLSFAGYTQEDILRGEDQREVIIIEMPAEGDTQVTYLAETTIGISAEDKLWVCSKIVETTSGGTNTTTISVMPNLEAPGVDGVNLPTFVYPNN